MADPEIPEAAITAAAEVLLALGELDSEECTDLAREVLAAALPHLDEDRHSSRMIDGVIRDGFGNRVLRCGPDCDLHVARAGKVQCDGTGRNCTEIFSPEAPDG